MTHEELHGQLMQTFRKQCEMWVINGGHLPFPEMATAAIATILEALSWPDEKMEFEGSYRLDDDGSYYATDVWRAMLAASPLSLKEERG